MKLRLRYCKLGKVRFVSHRDGARLWERAVRRVGLPVAYTAGFTPRPKLSFGLALPTGAESVAEYLDLELAEGSDIDPGSPDLRDGLSDALPSGMEVTVVAERAQRGDSLQESVTAATWVLSGPGIHAGTAQSAADRLLAAATLPVERVRKQRRNVDDVRPLILALAPDESGTGLVAELLTSGRALRPAELAAVAFPDIDPLDVRVLRTHQWIDTDDGRREVLPAPSTLALADGGRT